MAPSRARVETDVRRRSSADSVCPLRHPRPVHLSQQSSWSRDAVERPRPVKWWTLATAGEVTAFESNRLIELTTYEGAVLPKITHTFKADGDRTIYTRRIRFETSGLLKLLEPLMRRTPRNPNMRTAENLKLVLEGGQPK